MTDNMKRKTLRKNQIPDWVEILHWAIKALPVGYERQREIIETELRDVSREVDDKGGKYYEKTNDPENARPKRLTAKTCLFAFLMIKIFI